MKTKLSFLFLVSSSLLWIVLFFSCQKSKSTSLDDDLTVDAAKTYFEANAKTFKFFSRVGSNPIQSKSGLIESNNNFTIEWNNAHTTQTDISYIVEIPITSNSPIYAMLYDGSGHSQINRKRVIIRRALIIEKSKTNNTLSHYMLTLCGFNTNGEQLDYCYSINRTNYEGYEIYSSEDGKILKVYSYEQGVKRQSLLSKEYHNHVGEDGRDIHYKGLTLYASLGLTKAGGDGGATGEEEYHCPYCYGINPPNTLFCTHCGRFIDEEHYWDYFCPICNGQLPNCLCCHTCNWYPCLCDNNIPPTLCKYCGAPNCDGTLCLGEGNTPDPPTFNQPWGVTISIYPIYSGVTSAQYDYITRSYTLTATANYGYAFAYWGNLENELVSTSNPFIICPSADIHLVAVFTQN